ncbi:crotonase/enoyl-CoA hydratase family protein [Afifella sp. IM 167]|uniref:crotonase/enoyl-CoA hydratase family protein n=1 Tax=Afifella sp. IM 167 TaxID=2033586 RepID=UPI001CCB660C|nr:crotonase/enoyl-CoA hydratase family protein [Afifella sp. IM 167]MBZ8133426.1 enoyl-CoA hydratase [Afifella sp. IM 167]
MSDLLIEDRPADSGSIRLIRLNRPHKKNALTTAMYHDMVEALREAGEDADIAACVFLGHPGVFCAGNDIADLKNAGTDREGSFGLAADILNFLKELALSEKPLIAGVDGLAVGIGTTLLMHCDYVVAAETSTFRTPFVDLALVPEAASSLLAPRVMGHQRAFELLVMGSAFDARKAEMAGLVNTIVPEGAAEEAALKAAGILAAKPREAMLVSRRLLRGDREAVLARIDAEAELFGERLASREAQALFAAFLGS